MSASTVTLLLKPKVRDSQLLPPLLSILTYKAPWGTGEGEGKVFPGSGKRQQSEGGG